MERKRDDLGRDGEKDRGPWERWGERKMTLGEMEREKDDLGRDGEKEYDLWGDVEK